MLTRPGRPLYNTDMEHLGHTDFYEIVLEGVVIADIGIFRSEDDMTSTQAEADRLAARMGTTAQYDRCCEAYLP